MASPFLLLSGCSSSSQGHLTFLNPQGPIAASQRGHFFWIIGLMMIVVLPVIVLTPLIAWRYRYRNSKTHYSPNWDFAWPIEIAIWTVPMAIVVVLAIWLAHDTTALDPYAPIASRKPPLHVQVVGYDWKWLFIYPKYGIASVGELAVPAGRPLAMDLTSNTVMQSFFIPALGSQIYAMAGMTTHLHLEADRPGRFVGENTQYNGRGFQDQKFDTVAMSRKKFEAWVRRVKARGVPLTRTTYRTLEERNTARTLSHNLSSDPGKNAVVYFKSVSPKLFSRIVNSFHGGTEPFVPRHAPAGPLEVKQNSPAV